MIGLMPNTAVGYSNNLTVSLVDSFTLGSSIGNLYQIPGVTFGAASTGREIFVVMSLHNNAGPVVTSGTIGGVTAQISGDRFALMRAIVPTGTSGTITINVSQQSNSGSVAVFSVTNRRNPNAAPTTIATLGTSFVTSFSINNTYPINAVGLLGAITIAQSGSTAPNTTFSAPYTKVARDTGSGFENYTGYLLPKTTSSGTRTFAGTFGMTAALGGKLFIIE
jgi:hypothetical protein